MSKGNVSLQDFQQVKSIVAQIEDGLIGDLLVGREYAIAETRDGKWKIERQLSVLVFEDVATVDSFEKAIELTEGGTGIGVRFEPIYNSGHYRKG